MKLMWTMVCGHVFCCRLALPTLSHLIKSVLRMLPQSRPQSSKRPSLPMPSHPPISAQPSLGMAGMVESPCPASWDTTLLAMITRWVCAGHGLSQY